MISIVISQVRPFTQDFDVWLQGIFIHTGSNALRLLFFWHNLSQGFCNLAAKAEGTPVLYK